jgi:hypothetical protein
MPDVIPLKYAGARRIWSRSAITGLILGLGSGPITVVLVRLTGIAYGISLVGGAIAAFVGLAVAVYCVAAYLMARRHRLRGQSLALVGLALAILWAGGLIGLFSYVETQLT